MPKGKPENLKPFKPGQSGNPSGRPKAYQDFVDLVRKQGHARDALACLVANLHDEEGSVRNKAAEVILAYAYGKPPQSVQLEGAGGEALQVLIEINRTLKEGQ